MKRNFLLMLLLTLLPFAGWAQGPIVPVEVGTAADFKAVFTAAEGGAIKLTGDIALEEAITINDGKSYTIDLNEHEISSSVSVFKVYSGSLTLTGEGTVKCTKVYTKDNNETTPYVTVAMYGTGLPEGWTSSLTVGEEVTLIGGYSGIQIQPANNTDGADGVIVDFAGTVYPINGNDGNPPASANDNEGYIAIYLNGNVGKVSGDVPNITIRSTANIQADQGPAIYAAGYGKWTIEDGAKVKSAVWSALEARAGEFDIKGGLFTNTYDDADDPYGAAPFSTTKGASTYGAAFGIAQHTTALPISVSITGGEFKGPAALLVANPEQTTDNKVTVSVKGGSFDGGIEVTDTRVGKPLKGGLYSKSPDDNYVADGYSVFAFDDPTYKFAIYGEGEYDWAMSKKEGFYQASAWDPTITVFTPNNVLIPEFKDISGQTTRRNWIARYFRGLNDDNSVDEDTEVDDGMRHVGEYWVQPYLVSYSETDGEMEIGAAIGEPKKFTIKQPDLKLRLSQIYPFFHQKDVYAEWTTEGYKKVSTDPNSIDNENNTKVVNITYVQDPESNGLEGKPLSERLSDPNDDWWNDPDFDWEAAKKLRATEIDNFKLVNNLYNYSASGNLLRAFVIDNGKIYEDYKIQMQVPGYAWLEKNNAVIELNADEDLETINKVYGDKDPEGPYATVTDQDDADMSGEEYGADITITISREKEGKYEDAGTYDVYVDITGSDFVNYNFTGDYDETVEIEGGKRYIFKDAFTIEQYDLSTDETMAAIPDDPETTDVDESVPAKEEKVIIEIDDVTYNGTYQQVKPKTVKFLDVNDVLKPVVDGELANPVTTNLYVAGTPAVDAVLYADATEYNAAKGTELTDEEFAALSDEEKTKTPAVAAQPGYVILTEDVKAADAVEAQNAVYSFTSYGDAEGTNVYAEGTVEVTALTADKKGATIKVKENSVDGFVGNEYNIDATDPTDNTKLRQLFSTEGLAQPIWVKIQKVSDAVEAAPAVEAQAGDWTLAYLKADGKGTQKPEVTGDNLAKKRYTYYYNRYVFRDANGNVAKDKGECQIVVDYDIDDNREAETNSVNFTGRKFGSFTVDERNLRIRVVGTATFGSDPTYTLVQSGNTVDEGFVADEGRTGSPIDTWTTDNVTLNVPNTVAVVLPTDYEGNVGTYEITAALKHGVNRNKTALNYKPIFEGSTLTVSPLEIAFAAENQEVDYINVVQADKTYKAPDETTKTWTNLGDGKSVILDVDVADIVTPSTALPTGYKNSDFVELSCEGTSVGKHTLVLKKKENASTNITFTTTNGELTVKPLNEIRLEYGNVSQALEDHRGYGDGDGESMKVYLPKRRLNTDIWYGMVLPFEVYVPELSGKIGYASVALLKKGTSGDDVFFDTKVTKVPANEPFMLKVAPDHLDNGNVMPTTKLAIETAEICFENVTIQDRKYNGSDADDPYVETRDGGPKFIGSYKTIEYWDDAAYYVAKNSFSDKEAFLSYVDGKFYKGKNSPNHKMLTTDAYLLFPNTLAATRAQIFIDDEDGTVTAIEGIGAEPDEINSAKSAAEGIYNVAGQRVSRAQKGIFIKDGKKVLVK